MHHFSFLCVEILIILVVLQSNIPKIIRAENTTIFIYDLDYQKDQGDFKLSFLVKSQIR